MSGIPPFDPQLAVSNVLGGRAPGVVAMAVGTLSTILGPQPLQALQQAVQDNTLATLMGPEVRAMLLGSSRWARALEPQGMGVAGAQALVSSPSR